MRHEAPAVIARSVATKQSGGQEPRPMLAASGSLRLGDLAMTTLLILSYPLLCDGESRPRSEAPAHIRIIHILPANPVSTLAGAVLTGHRIIFDRVHMYFAAACRLFLGLGDLRNRFLLGLGLAVRGLLLCLWLASSRRGSTLSKRQGWNRTDENSCQIFHIAPRRCDCITFAITLPANYVVKSFC